MVVCTFTLICLTRRKTRKFKHSFRICERVTTRCIKVLSYLHRCVVLKHSLETHGAFRLHCQTSTDAVLSKILCFANICARNARSHGQWLALTDEVWIHHYCSSNTHKFRGKYCFWCEGFFTKIMHTLPEMQVLAYLPIVRIMSCNVCFCRWMLTMHFRDALTSYLSQ